MLQVLLLAVICCQAMQFPAMQALEWHLHLVEVVELDCNTWQM